MKPLKHLHFPSHHACIIIYEVSVFLRGEVKSIYNIFYGQRN